MQVRQASDRFWATRDRGDAAAFAAEFTEDGMFMVPGLADATGRTAIRDLAQIRFTKARTRDFKNPRREIEVLGDMAYELGWFSEVLGKDDPVRMLGRYLLVWKRGNDNVWRVSRYVYSFSGTEPVN